MVELLDYFGDDLRIVNAARVSYGKWKSELDEKDLKLLQYLAIEQHEAPWRHPHFTFRITCPIYVERQLFKHQVGLSANSISGRYVDFSDSYTVIKEWRKQSKSSKQGSEGALEESDQNILSDLEKEVIEVCAKAYKTMTDMGVAKEQARTILPLNLNTTFIWTGSLLSFIRIFKLRLKPDVQVETYEVAREMLDCIKNIPGQPFKHSLEVLKL
jgi:thymidylate synthase (FAD)